ncbi:MAG: ATP-dependent DNA helicase RecG [Oscillospiraceae bacterium]|nr:ATP-dependent DNA helicase RecG [Oscillospiraceae bacterium]
MNNIMNTDIQYLKGIGKTRAEQFKKLGITNIGELLYTFPRYYEDWKNIRPIKLCVPDEKVCIKAIVSFSPSVYKTPGGMIITKLSATDGESVVMMTFFGNKYVAGQLKEGEEYLFFGKLSGGSGGYFEMTSPRFCPAENNEFFHPVYSLTSGLSSKIISNAVKNALRLYKDNIPDPISEETVLKYKLCPLGEALRLIHFPQSEDDISAARRRLIYEELLVLQLGLLKRNDADDPTDAYLIKDDFAEEFFSLLPFSPTNAQKRSVKECLADMSEKKPMRRLLQGDVGSGKTAVAAALIYCAAKSGFQSALMAPTEVLARQHFNSFSSFFAGTGVSVALLTGSTKASERKNILAALKNGDISLLIGTHAVITESVEFNNLALCVTDEQHRFGVTQRSSLRAKGKDPHVLVMSATPIPRTLSLIIYGDLSISVLDEKPKGRQEIDTFCVPSSFHERIHAFIKKQLDAGRQGYIVCPLVEEKEEENEDEEIKNRRLSAKKYMKELSEGVFKDYPTALLHGKLKPKEKDAVMNSFASGKTKLLICTTVIEVGIDVPNANIIVIENAECFGLSQLHQLRGRTGRGNEKSYCILISDAEGETARRRFDIMKKTNDGFKIAEEDLAIRGPGDFFGSRQSGLPSMKIADLMTDSKIMYAAGRDAKKILEEDPSLTLPKNQGLKKSVQKLFADIS